MFRKKRKTTEVTLTNANLTAMNEAFAAMKVCFGSDLDLRFVTIRQDDRDSLDYDVALLVEMPTNVGSINADGEVRISLAHYNNPITRYHMTGTIMIRMNGGIGFLEGDHLDLVCEKDGYALAEHSKPVLAEFRERVKDYRTNWE